MHAEAQRRGGKKSGENIFQFSSLRLLRLCVSLFIVLPLSAQTSTTYRLDTSPDAWLAPLAGTLSIGAYLATQSTQGLTAADLAALNKADIPAFDRWATEYSSTGVRTASDIALGISLALPVLVLSEFSDDYIHLAGMYAETMALTWSVTNFIKTSGRIRPLAYNPDASLADRQSADMRQSFLSGHTSASVAALVFLATIYEGYKPGTTMTKVFWVGGIGLGLTTGALRIFSGMHFPTDVLAGAVVGGIIGYMVPKLHEQEKVSVGIAPASAAPPMLTVRIVL